MKSLRIIGSILFGLTVAVSLFAPAEAQALVPVSLHDFVFGMDGVTMGMATISLTSLSRKERQVANLGGIAKLYLFGESDFTGDWPKASDVVAGVVSTASIPLKAGVVAAVLTFDRGTARIKSDKKGKVGYQNFGLSGECKFAGYSAEQMVALQLLLNEGGVAIAVYKDGTRVIVGTSYEPLEFEHSTDSGAKADDQLMIDLKFKGDGYAFAPPVLAASVVIPLPA